jgi:hypothetical protein
MTGLARDIAVGIAFAALVIAVVFGSFRLGETQSQTVTVPGPVVTVDNAACTAAVAELDAIVQAQGLALEAAVNGTSAVDLSNEIAAQPVLTDTAAAHRDAVACSR